MGSGLSGAYAGTRGGSQPYAETYHVVDEMLRADKKDPDIYDPKTGYFKNPSAISLREAVRNNRCYRRQETCTASYTCRRKRPSGSVRWYNNIKSMAKVEVFLQKLYEENRLLFDKKSKWRQRKGG